MRLSVAFDRRLLVRMPMGDASIAEMPTTDATLTSTKPGDNNDTDAAAQKFVAIFCCRQTVNEPCRRTQTIADQRARSAVGDELTRAHAIRQVRDDEQTAADSERAADKRGADSERRALTEASHHLLPVCLFFQLTLTLSFAK